MNQNKMAKRIIVYVIGVLTLALGVVLNTKSGLGVSTTNSVPFVVSKGSMLTLGQACTIVYLADVLFQCIVYRKIKIKVILQFPFSIVFGLIVDMFNKIIILSNPDLGIKIVFLALGIILSAIGISMVVNMDFVPNPPDGAVQALVTLLKRPFGRSKIIYDGIMLIIAVSVSLLLNGKILGIGIGTIIAFFTIGNTISLINKKFGAFFLSIHDKNQNEKNSVAKVAQI